ncbi:hypothetical protein B0H14DRAFT_2616167 [Mycena olivaceomarginata]|nr:hypothetical protein B0H14DRAFT_2616167 [Mycena olivaceomarginata]
MSNASTTIRVPGVEPGSAAHLLGLSQIHNAAVYHTPHPIVFIACAALSWSGIGMYRRVESKSGRLPSRQQTSCKKPYACLRRPFRCRELKAVNPSLALERRLLCTAHHTRFALWLGRGIKMMSTLSAEAKMQSWLNRLDRVEVADSEKLGSENVPGVEPGSAASSLRRLRCPVPNAAVRRAPHPIMGLGWGGVKCCIEVAVAEKLESENVVLDLLSFYGSEIQHTAKAGVSNISAPPGK